MLVVVDKNFDIERVNEDVEHEVRETIHSFGFLINRLRITVGIFILNKIAISVNTVLIFNIMGLHIFPVIITGLLLFFDFRYVMVKLDEAWPLTKLVRRDNRHKIWWMMKKPILIISTERIDLLNGNLPIDNIHSVGTTKQSSSYHRYDDDMEFHVYAVKDERTAMLVKLAN
jgi:hypothetical protein